MSDLLNSKTRDKVEIIAAIIASAQKPSRSTQIIEKSGLSYKLLKKYLKMMIEHSLIENINNDAEERKLFQATSKGIEFLGAYCKILKIVYGDDFMKRVGNLAVYCLKFCQDE